MSAFSALDLDQLWQRLHEYDDAKAREVLILHHMPYARMIAATCYGKRFHDEIAFDDYLQWATLGMIESLDRFDSTKGAQFKTFAMRRMQGAVLDGVAKATEKQQQITLQTRLKKERLESIKRKTANAAQGQSIQETDTAKISPEDFLHHLADVGIGLALAWLLEDSAMVVADERIADLRQIPYLQIVEIKQLQDQIRHVVEELPAQQRTVIKEHYLEELPFETIATKLGLTKGRISQIHKQALQALRHNLKQMPKCDVAY